MVFCFGRYVGNTVLWRTYSNPTLISTVRVSKVRGTTSQNHAISRKIGSQFLIIRIITVNLSSVSLLPPAVTSFSRSYRQWRVSKLAFAVSLFTGTSTHTGLSTLLCAQSKCSRQDAPTLHCVLIQFYRSQHISTRFEPGLRKRAFWLRGFHVLRKIHQPWHKHATC